MLAVTESDLHGLKIEDPYPNYTWACSALTLQTKKEGFFKDYAEQVESSLSASSLAKFGRLTSDEARLEFCYGLKSTHCLEAKPFYRAKCGEDSAGLRDQAELFLKVGNPKAALQLLSRSVVRAPAPTSAEDGGQKLLARSLATRTEALFALGRHELALRDSQCALSAGLPQGSSRCRLLEIQGYSYEATGQMLRAKLAFISAAQLLDTSEENKEWREKLQNSAVRCEQLIPAVTATNNNAGKQDNKSLPELTSGSSSELPGASSLLTVSKDPSAGRYVTALESIKAGDTLLVEPAYVACLLTEKAGTHCHHCFKRLEAPIGCPVCSGVAFCSTDCQVEACETYHKTECRFNNLFIGSGMSILCHLALRIITKAGSAEKFEQMWRVANQEQSKKKSKKDNNPDVEKYCAVFNLVGHETQRTTKDFLHRTLMAIFLLKCLQEANFFNKNKISNSVISPIESHVGQALLKHLQILQFNAHEVFETLARAHNVIKGSRAQYIGVALYSSVALFNHDCYPAVGRTFSGTNIIIQALRPLQVGQTVAENYGPIFTKRTKDVRQKSLRSRYWFSCQCQACNQDWPSYDKGIPIQEKSQMALNTYSLAFNSMEAGNLDEAIILFTEFINSLHSEITLPDREICLAIDALRLCLAARWGTVVIPEIREKPKQEGVQIAELVE